MNRIPWDDRFVSRGESLLFDSTFAGDDSVALVAAGGSVMVEEEGVPCGGVAVRGSVVSSDSMCVGCWLTDSTFFHSALLSSLAFFESFSKRSNSTFFHCSIRTSEAKRIFSNPFSKT
jgi:hypothetical protein